MATRRGFLSGLTGKGSGAPKEAEGDVVWDKPDVVWDKPMMSRAAALKCLAVGGVAAVAGCRGKEVNPDDLDPSWPDPIAVSHVATGKTAIYYDKMPTNVLDLQALRSYEEVIVAPPNLAPGQLSNAVGYAAIAAINRQEIARGEADPKNVIAARIVKLSKDIAAVQGELRDESGKIVGDPLSGLDAKGQYNSYIVDLRNDRAYGLMKDYILSIGREYNGVFIDIIDSIIALEGQSPKQYGGLTAKAVQLMQEVAQALPQGKKFMVNGGLQSTATLSQIAQIPNLSALSVEAQYFAEDSVKRPVESLEQWTKPKLAAAFRARNQASQMRGEGGGKLRLIAIEPVNPDRRQKSVCNLAQQYERWSTDISVTPRDFQLDVSVYACPQQQYMNSNGRDLQENTQLQIGACQSR